MFATYGRGGYPIEWLTNGTAAYFRFLKNLKNMIQLFGKVDGILFHQGESNNNLNDVASAEKYKSEFRMLLFNLLDEGIDTPVYISRVSVCNSPSDTELLRVQSELAEEFSNARYGPNTDLLASVYRTSDKCHFSRLGKMKVAEMWYEYLFP